jgi:hypothetical protein
MTWLALALVAAAGGPLEPEDVPDDVYLDRSGMPELTVQSAFHGATIGTLVTQSIFGDSDPNRAAAGTLVGLGLGIGVPILALRKQPVHGAEAALWVAGMRWGLLTGVLLPGMWGSRTSWHYGATAGVLTLAGLGTAIWAQPRAQLDPGQVSALGSAHTFGTIAAGLVMVIYDVVPDNGLAFSAPVLLVSNAGMVAAYVLRDDFSVDRRRIIWADIGGYIGLGAGLGVAYLAVGNDRLRSRLQIVGASMLAGMCSGLALGYFASDDLDAYKRSAPPSTLGLSLELEPPQPTVIGTVDRRGEPKVVPGVDLVRGTW